MIKVILIIASCFLFLFFLVVSYANGLLRGFKIMATKGIKMTELEERVSRQLFKKEEGVEPFFYSKYWQEELNKTTQTIKKQQQTEKLLKAEAIKSKKNKTENVKPNY